MTILVWLGLGTLGGIALSTVFVLGFLPHWIANAEDGTDPADQLPTFDDDEAAALLEAGA